MRKKYLILTIWALLICNVSSATHNLAGEITYPRIGNLKVLIKVKTFARLSSVPADRDSLVICFGDGGFCQWAIRMNGPDNDNNGIPDGEVVGPDHKMSIYTQTHTYASGGEYTVSMQDPNRNAGILNINSPFSENVAFYIETTFQLDAGVWDNSPIFLEFPIDKGIIGEDFNAGMPTPPFILE